jgi:hypothetical protein
MIVAGAISIVGAVLSFVVGSRMFGHGPAEIWRAILASELAAFVCLPVTLYSQRTPRLKFLSKGTIRSWMLLSGLYFGVLLLICPWLRSWVALGWMFGPLLMCTGLMIIIYGPLHDRIIRRTQEKTRLIR